MIRRMDALTIEQLDWCKTHIPAFQKAADQVQAVIAEMEASKQKFSEQLKVRRIVHGAR